MYKIDGSTLTFDPSDSDTDHLEYSWSCSYSTDTISNANCSNIIISSKLNGVITPNFTEIANDIIVGQTMEFNFVLTVFDIEIPARSSCETGFTMIFDVQNSTNGEEDVVLLASIKVVQNEVNINGVIRLLSKIDYDSNNITEYEYLWYESNGLISQKDIWKYQSNAINKSNLVLIASENIFEEGVVYTISVKITNINSGTVAVADTDVCYI